MATSNSFFYGTGRRKTSIARVRLLQGEGEIVVNGGRRGLQIVLKPSDLIAATSAEVSPLRA